LQDGERRITDLAAELGGSQTSISSHVTSLKACGLITGRSQGRSIYYRLARPELGSLLEAAERLLLAQTGSTSSSATAPRIRPRTDTRLTQPRCGRAA